MDKSKKTLGLSIIVKDEEHVIERMLNTVYPILDFYTVIDTGSTDKTREVIKKFFDSKGIKGQIIDRPFDNFENSRNFAMQEAKPYTDYCIWIDADEELIIDDDFDVDKLDKDLYMINTFIDSMKYTRNEIWSNKKSFRWYGPVHEFIVPNDKDIKSEIIEGLKVIVHMDGGSWINSETHVKYKEHSKLLEDYINEKDRDPRWIFYTAQSYHDSARVPNNNEENEERFRRSIKYYKERVNIPSGYPEEIYYSQYRIGTISNSLELPWKDTLQELLKAYEIDPLRAEPFKIIIDHYQQMGQWPLSYLYSKFAVENFHDKNPFPDRLLFVDESLYNWRFLELHATSCFYMRRQDEGRENFKKLMDIVKNNTNLFTPGDIQRIQVNSSHILSEEIK